MAFPTSNLPSASVPWGREVEKQVSSLTAMVKSNEVNNTARDNQLASSYKRLDTTVTQVGIVAAQAQAAADDAADAAAAANASLAEIGAVKTNIYFPGTTQINGTTIKTGTLSADTITTGTLTGVTVQTGSSGQRVVLGGSQINFYDSSNSLGATMSASSSALGITNGGNALSVNNIGAHMTGGSTGVYCGDYGSGTSVLKLVGSSTEATGALYSSGVLSTGSNLLANSGFVQSLPTYTNTAASGRVMYVASNGTFNCSTSSARYKQDITPYAVDINKIMQLQPVSFRYKKAVEENGDSADVAHGFIAEQATEIGLTEFVDFEADENGNLRPDNFRYIDFTAALHSVIKQQQETIESLTARIEALESKV